MKFDAETAIQESVGTSIRVAMKSLYKHNVAMFLSIVMVAVCAIPLCLIYHHYGIMPIICLIGLFSVFAFYVGVNA